MPVVVTGAGHVLLGPDDPPCDPTPWLRVKKGRKFMGVQDDLAVVAAAQALAAAALPPPLLDRVGLYLTAGYIPFDAADLDAILNGSLRDGAFSSCNLYAFLKPNAVKAAAVFNTGGQFAKRPKRLIAAFGVPVFIAYKSRLLKLATFLSFLSRMLRVKTKPVLIPFAEGPIDVDRQVDWDLANRIISEREKA